MDKLAYRAFVLVGLLCLLFPALPVRAATRGNPWINLLDGAPVPTTYAGAAGLLEALEKAQPLALAADDFDEDGMPDLVVGYASGAGYASPFAAGMEGSSPPFTGGTGADWGRDLSDV